MRLKEPAKEALRHISNNPGASYVEIRDACGEKAATSLYDHHKSNRTLRRKGENPRVWRYWLPHDFPSAPVPLEPPVALDQEASTDFLIIEYLRSHPDSTAKQVLFGIGRVARKRLLVLHRNGTLSRTAGRHGWYVYRIAVPVGDAEAQTEVPTATARDEANDNPAVVALVLRRDEVQLDINMLKAKRDELDAAIQLVIEVLE